MHIHGPTVFSKCTTPEVAHLNLSISEAFCFSDVLFLHNIEYRAMLNIYGENFNKIGF